MAPNRLRTNCCKSSESSNTSIWRANICRTRVMFAPFLPIARPRSPCFTMKATAVSVIRQSFTSAPVICSNALMHFMSSFVSSTIIPRLLFCELYYARVAGVMHCKDGDRVGPPCDRAQLKRGAVVGNDRYSGKAAVVPHVLCENIWAVGCDYHELCMPGKRHFNAPCCAELRLARVHALAYRAREVGNRVLCCCFFAGHDNYLSNHQTFSRM